jgi:hypothetical protein
MKFSKIGHGNFTIEKTYSASVYWTRRLPGAVNGTQNAPADRSARGVSMKLHPPANRLVSQLQVLGFAPK